jgi:hypothetical protein
VRVTGKVLERPKQPEGDGAPAPSSSSDDDGPSDVVLAVGGLGGILVGLLGGGALAGMRRRPA